MRATGARWWARNEYELNNLTEWIRRQWSAGKTPTLMEMQADRTSSQNSMFYALYRDIAAALEDKTLIEVKRECKLRYGVAIRKAADPEWSEWYDQAIKPMTYEQKLFLMDDYPITSAFSKQQGSDYISSILADYARMGVPIPDPRR